MRVEEAIGRQVSRLRAQRQLSLTDLGEALGRYLDKPWSRQAVHQAERGQRSFTAGELTAASPGRVGRGVPGHPAQPRPGGAAGRGGGADRRAERHRRGPRAPGAGPAGEDRAGGQGVVAKTVAASKLPVAGSPTDRTGLETAVEPMRLIRVIAYPGRWSPRGKSDSFRPNWRSRWARSALSSAFGHGVPVRLDKSLASGRKSRETAMFTAI